MALAAVNISRKGRRILLIILLIIIVIQTSLGVLLMILGISAEVQLGGGTLHPLDEKQFHKLFHTLIAMGVTLTVLYLCGIKVCYDCACPAVHLETGNKLLIWTIASLTISSLCIALAVFIPGTTRSLMYQLTNSLHRGMSQYLNDPQWRLNLDTMQQGLHCCGVERYTNWYSTPWINMDFLRQDSRTVQHYSHSDGRVLPPITPWSCCNPKVLTPCFHDILQQKRYAIVWKRMEQLIEDSMYTDGCLSMIQAMLDKLSKATTAVTVTIFTLQALITILLRYLYTSSRNAIMLGDPHVKTYGWLFGRGDLGYNRGTPLPQLMNKQVSEVESQLKDNESETEAIAGRNTKFSKKNKHQHKHSFPKEHMKSGKHKTNITNRSEDISGNTSSDNTETADPILLAKLLPR